MTPQLPPIVLRHNRLLVTGYRYYQDRDLVAYGLFHAWKALGSRPDTVLIQGECPYGGADLFAKEVWEGWGLPVHGVPADRDPVTGTILGPQRNAKMVALGADGCLAFPTAESRGTSNCMRLAREAGIPVWEFAQWWRP